MKSLEELAIGPGNLPELLTKVILEEVEEAARARRFGRNLVRINEDLVRTKGRELVFYRRTTLTASKTMPGSIPTESQVSYSPNTLIVDKYAVGTKITQEAMDGSNLDLIRDTIREAGIALADKEDEVILDALFEREGKTETLSAGTGTFNLSFLPIISHLTFSTVTPAVTSINYKSGKIIFEATLPSTVTVTYNYSTLPADVFVDPEAAGTFAYKDIITAANRVRGKKWSPDFLLIHPDQMASLLKEATFVDASKYGAREPLLRGEIGQISGLRVLVSTNAAQGAAYIVASKRAGWLAIKRHLDLKRWDNPGTDSIELYFFMEFGAKLTDPDAVAMVVNLGEKATLT